MSSSKVLFSIYRIMRSSTTFCRYRRQKSPSSRCTWVTFNLIYSMPASKNLNKSSRWLSLRIWQIKRHSKKWMKVHKVAYLGELPVKIWLIMSPIKRHFNWSWKRCASGPCREAFIVSIMVILAESPSPSWWQRFARTTAIYRRRALFSSFSRSMPNQRGASPSKCRSRRSISSREEMPCAHHASRPWTSTPPTRW